MDYKEYRVICLPGDTILLMHERCENARFVLTDDPTIAHLIFLAENHAKACPEKSN